MNVKPGRNDPCPCGSGKKFKICCQGAVKSRLTVPKISSKNTSPTVFELNHLAALFNSGNYKELETHARWLVELYPDSGIAWKVLGGTLQAHGKDALHAMQNAAKLLPKDADAHNKLGDILLDLGELYDAATCYIQAIDAQSDFVEAHYNLGNALFNLGKINDAVTSYCRVMEIKPDYAGVHCNLGAALYDLGKLDDAVISYLREIAINPEFAEAHYNLGNTLRDLNKLDDAAASYRLALKIRPDYSDAHCNMGTALCNLGKLDDAVESYRRAIEIKPDYAGAYCNLGNVQLDLGEPDAAAISYIHALEIKSDFADAYYNLGNILRDLGRPDDAVASYRRAIKIRPDNAEVHVNLGDVLLFYASDLSTAKQHFEIALDHNSDLTNAHQGLACIYHRLGNEEKSSYHRNKGFEKQPLSNWEYRGREEPVQLLILGSAFDGNIPWRLLIDREIFHTTIVSVEYFDSQLPLPSHELIFNTIGDADLCQRGLEIATRLIERTQAPIINHPKVVLQTGRLINAERLGILPGVVSPRMAPVLKNDLCSGHALEILAQKGIEFPFLLRPLGFHMGNFFVYIDNHEALTACLDILPSNDLFAIEFLDSRSDDNLFRKFRVMSINGKLYPLHMAISAEWKVHYFSSDMDSNVAYRIEENEFLNDYSAYLGANAMLALEKLSQTIGLDYWGIDFGLDRNGNILLYEANATMVIPPLNQDAQWKYKCAAIKNALVATKRMFIERSAIRMSTSDALIKTPTS